jgi:hypothetical protein
MMAVAALSPVLEAALSRVEQQLEAVSVAAGQEDPAALESLSAVLRQLVLDFSVLAEGQRDAFASPDAQRRLNKVAQGLSSQREGLIRRSVSVERALQALIPAVADASTYVPSAAGAAYGPGRRRYEA